MNDDIDILERLQSVTRQRDACLAALKELVLGFDGETDCTELLELIGGFDSKARAAIHLCEP